MDGCLRREGAQDLVAHCRTLSEVILCAKLKLKHYPLSMGGHFTTETRQAYLRT